LEHSRGWAVSRDAAAATAAAGVGQTQTTALIVQTPLQSMLNGSVIAIFFHQHDKHPPRMRVLSVVCLHAYCCLLLDAPCAFLASVQVMQRLAETQHDTALKNFGSFYSSELGGIVTQPGFMVVHMDDHMVHKGDAVAESGESCTAFSSRHMLFNERLLVSFAGLRRSVARLLLVAVCITRQLCTADGMHVHLCSLNPAECLVK
jgi:hypothetical protein